jgi:hypothetical protein
MSAVTATRGDKRRPNRELSPRGSSARAPALARMLHQRLCPDL